MGLCYSRTEKGFGKSHYPYKDVTPLALLLWRHHLPWVRTLIRIVYEKERIDPMMREYGSMLERTGATVEWVPAGQMNCVTASQLVRLFAIEVEEVKPEDIVVTVDVNLFPMTSHLLDPILQHPEMVAWVAQYEDTASISTGRGETFNQNLIALRARDWVRITGYSGSMHRFRIRKAKHNIDVSIPG